MTIVLIFQALRPPTATRNANPRCQLPILGRCQSRRPRPQHRQGHQQEQ